MPGRFKFIPKLSLLLVMCIAGTAATLFAQETITLTAIMPRQDAGGSPVTGSYRGNDSTSGQAINVGFRPSAILIFVGRLRHGDIREGGLDRDDPSMFAKTTEMDTETAPKTGHVEGYGLKFDIIEFTDTGFTVYHKAGGHHHHRDRRTPNSRGRIYYYVAWP